MHSFRCYYCRLPDSRNRFGKLKSRLRAEVAPKKWALLTTKHAYWLKCWSHTEVKGFTVFEWRWGRAIATLYVDFKPVQIALKLSAKFNRSKCKYDCRPAWAMSPCYFSLWETRKNDKIIQLCYLKYKPYTYWFKSVTLLNANLKFLKVKLGLTDRCLKGLMTPSIIKLNFTR